MRFESRRSNVVARNGMVATSQPLAAITGLRVLMEGGNAVDAAVATAAVLNVVEPHSTGIGGDVFPLVRMAEDGKVRSLNASGRSPRAASLGELRSRGLSSVPTDSPYAITVPGAVKGWSEILRACGTMPIREVLKPAIKYASAGYPASEVISAHWESAAGRLGANPSGRELLPGGRAPRAGEAVRLPELAHTLQTVAEGGEEAFYRGPLAEGIARFVQQLGGWLSTADMASCDATWDEAIYTDYRGLRCWQCPPNSQGLDALMALNLIEGYDIPGMGSQSPEAYHHLIECMKLALADGLSQITDPTRMRVATQQLLSKEYAKGRRKSISPHKATESMPAVAQPSRSDTVYISVVDGHGNACSFINSLYMGFGAGLVAPGTGIALQNRGASFSLDPEHPNSLEPNKRPFHTLVPGMVTRDGKLWICYGVMGAMQQAQGHLQALVNMIDFGLSPQAALDAPRFSVRPGEGVAIENIATPAIVEQLRSKGHNIIVRPPHGVYFGGGQIIQRDTDSETLTGGSEPRLDGCAIGW